MTSPAQNRIDREKWGVVVLGVLTLVVAALLVVAFLKPGRTEADSRASAEAVEQMDHAQAQDTAARRQAEKGQRSDFD